MKLGIIGPPNSVNEIKSCIDKSYLYVDTVLLPYNDYKETVSILKKYQSQLDGILFSGTTPFEYASRFVSAEKHWEYVPRTKLSLICSLLKAGYIKGWDITRVSIDSYDEDLVYDAYEEVGYTRDNLTIFESKRKDLENDYLDYLYEFHTHLYHSKKVACCITGIEIISQKLANENIPCMMISHASDVIVQLVNKIYLDYQIKINEEQKISTIAIEISYMEEHSVYSQNILQSFYYKKNVAELIYIFAQKIGAAILESNDNTFYLFTTKQVIENETDSFRKFDLLRKVASKSNVKNIFVGIGLGENASQSKYNAEIGRKNAKASTNDCMFVVYENQKISGPVTSGKLGETEKIIDKKLYDLSQKTGVSVACLGKLSGILHQYNITAITPVHLAQLYGVSSRSMNRILSKLEDGGYVTIIGKEAKGVSGRPNRVIRINLNDD